MRGKTPLITPHVRNPDWGVIVPLLKGKSGLSYVKFADKIGLCVGTLYGLAKGEGVSRMHWTTGDVILSWAEANFSDEEKARCGL